VSGASLDSRLPVDHFPVPCGTGPRELPARIQQFTNSRPSACRAILDLKNQRDKLHQYQKRVIVLTDRETAIAKQCLARNDRRRALLALRRKKYQESLLAKTDAQLEQLEQLTGQVEFALVQKDVVYGLQQGTQVLRAINKEMGGIQGIEKLMGETDDARSYQEVKVSEWLAWAYVLMGATMQDISQMLAGQLSNQDEEEVEDELEALQGPAERPVVLPDAPVSRLSEDRRKAEEEQAERRAHADEQAPVLTTA
jgi:charged multivesicular body protein 6